MTRKIKTALLVLTFGSSLALNAEVLTWKSNVGQQYEVTVTIKESVTGLDSITKKPVEVVKEAPLQETAAQNKSTRPNLKSIISFPRSSVEIGSNWTGTAQVTYDLTSFGIEEPLSLDVPVTWKVTGLLEQDGRVYYEVYAAWAPYYSLPKPMATRSGIDRISGYSTMVVYWDNKAGAPKQSTLIEETQYRFTDGTSLMKRTDTEEEFRTVTDIVRERIVSQLKEQIVAQKVQNVEVTQTEEGIKLTIENIQFEPDSAVLVEAEKAKLLNIGKVLSSLTGQKLSIIGHAANTAGSNEAELLTLSTARAESVAKFLVEAGIKTAEEVVSSGKGGTEPVASNDTPEGRSKNRRVEIIIIDGETAE